ncbi:MAG: ABC transporter substrate-binding protein, partial [Oscillibacter sp.]
VGRTDEVFHWADLQGTTVIGGRKGGMPEMTLEYVMRQNGVIPGEDVTVDTSIQFNMMAGAFTGGNGDYVALFEPTATQVELEGKGYVLTSIGQESGEIPYTAFFAAQSYLEEHPAVAQGFTNAVARGQTWVREHSAAEIADAIVDQFPDTDAAVLTKVAQRYQDIDAWNETPVMKQEALERLETVMETAGELAEWVDFHQLVNNTYAQAVK